MMKLIYEVMRKFHTSSKITNRLGVGVASVLLFSITHSQAADIIAKQETSSPYDKIGFSWDGLYFGGQMGYGFGKSGISYQDDTYKIDYPFTLSGRGVKGGVYAGYNFPINDATIFSIETDFMLSNMSDKMTSDILFKNNNDQTVRNRVNLTSRENWTGATRARLGFANGRYLSYISAGLAYASIKTNTITTNATQIFTFNNDDLMMGWNVGTGFDYAWNDHLTIRLEYRYNDYGDNNISAPNGDLTDGYKTQLRTNEIRVGIGYKF